MTARGGKADRAQPKQTLEIFRDLCLGRSDPDDALCALFDRETQDGAEMEHYSDMLAAALRDIERRFRGRAIERLQLDRGALLVAESAQARRAEDFELITWLVIR